MFTARHVTRRDDAGFALSVFFPWTEFQLNSLSIRIIGVSKTYATMAHSTYLILLLIALSSFVTMQTAESESRRSSWRFHSRSKYLKTSFCEKHKTNRDQVEIRKY